MLNQMSFIRTRTSSRPTQNQGRRSRQTLSRDPRAVLACMVDGKRALSAVAMLRIMQSVVLPSTPVS